MATWTAAELRNAVLTRLGITQAGQSASAEDAAVVDTAYTSIYARLRRLGVATWGKGSIEEGAQQPLSKYLASEVAPQFGFSGQALAEKEKHGEDGWRELLQMSAGSKQPRRVKIEAF